MGPGLKNKVQKAYLLSDQEQKPLPISQNDDCATVQPPRRPPIPLHPSGPHHHRPGRGRAAAKQVTTPQPLAGDGSLRKGHDCADRGI